MLLATSRHCVSGGKRCLQCHRQGMLAVNGSKSAPLQMHMRGLQKAFKVALETGKKRIKAFIDAASTNGRSPREGGCNSPRAASSQRQNTATALQPVNAAS